MASLNAVAATFRVYTSNGASHWAYALRPHNNNVDRQKIVAGILWGIPEMRRLAENKGMKEGAADLGDLLDVTLVRGLCMPRILAEVGVGRNRLDQLAEYRV
ncbi:hypothetical protein B0H11DRAFT_2270143 [Mycena galericulata]|nr:hypothetical protein B0H11DRAFT_2270143 [Mycena galericulata]